MRTATVARRVATAAALVAAGALVGCANAPKPMYQWDGFQDQLYQHFKAETSSPDDQAQALEALAVKARAAGASLPPGFRAHRAMVYLRLGREDEARQQLEGEKAAFPESSAYMDFLLKRLRPATPAAANHPAKDL